MSVTCSACGGSNPDEARFCSHCGAAVTRSCPSCGTDAAPEARFCLACGSPLSVEEGPIPVEPSSEERRIVSVMFCDLAGFTAHTERSDPEDVRSRLTAFHATVRQDVERFGGRVEKLMGDGVFSVFGAPTAHEDDPERAVQAALRVVNSISELNDARGLDLLLRISVTTGEAIVQMSDRPDREGIVGDVVNTASRLEAVAALGTVVVDERTFRATRHTIEYSPLDPVTLKGKVDAVPIWRAEAAKSRFGVAVDEAPDTPFVGRAEEMSLLLDAFDRTLARSSAQLVTVTGEPGSGKSRLIREFRRAVDDRDDLVFWRQGRCLPYGEGVTFWAIGEIVKSHAGILESETPEAATSKLTEAVGVVVEDEDQARWITSRLQPLVGAFGEAGGSDRSELFAAWTRFFEALAARNPLVLVIEDLHWADDPVVDFIDHLTEWAADSPILVVATARPELYTDRPDWGGGKRDAVTASLASLSDRDAAALMSALADRPVMSSELQSNLLAQSGGNPLYVTEYVRLAVEQDWFGKADRGEDLPLPDSIQAIIGARIDLLSAEDKTLLQTASVVGRVFWTAALSFADVGSPEEVREGLRRLIRRELVRPVRRSSMQGHDEYAFGHVLIRDVAYARLTRDERARLHASTARWLEAVSGDRVNEVAELIAHHLSTSYELSPADDPEMKRRIYRFLMTALERAAMLDAKAALALARRAVEFASDDRELGRALIEVGQGLFSSTDEAISGFETAIDALQRAGDREGEVKATMWLGRLRWYMGDGGASDALGDRVLELVEGLPASSVVADAIVAVASGLQLHGREDEALDLVERGLAVAQAVGDTRVFARALVIKGSAVIQIGDAEGLGDIEEGLKIQLDLNEARAAMSTYNNLATVLNDNGDSHRSREQITEAIALGEARGLTSQVDWSHLTLVESLFMLGEWDRLWTILDEREDMERIRGTQIHMALRFWRCLLLHFRGNPKQAWQMFPSILDLARDAKDPQAVVPSVAFGIGMALDAGEVASGRRLVSELVELSAEHPVFLGFHLSWAGGAVAQLGMLDELALLSRRAGRSYPWIALRMQSVDAVLSASAGRHSEAFELLEPLIIEADQRGIRVVAMAARIQAARSAVALGDTDGANELLDAAARDAGLMGAGLFLQRIDEIRGEAEAATGT